LKLSKKWKSCTRQKGGAFTTDEAAPATIIKREKKNQEKKKPVERKKPITFKGADCRYGTAGGRGESKLTFLFGREER